MITPKQLTTLQQYADEKNKDITLKFDGDRVVVYHLGEKYIGLSNRVSSCLTMKSVKYHIDKCADYYGKGCRQL